MVPGYTSTLHFISLQFSDITTGTSIFGLTNLLNVFDQIFQSFLEEGDQL